MKFKILAAIVIALAVSAMPLAAMAHEGHHHAKTTKAKVKKVAKPAQR